jgi:hypothetical protein
MSMRGVRRSKYGTCLETLSEMRLGPIGECRLGSRMPAGVARLEVCAMGGRAVLMIGSCREKER